MTYEEAVKDMAEESSDDGTDGDDVVSMQGDVIEGETVFLGTYEQDADDSNGKEDIEWQVLKVEEGRALIVSKYALDCQCFDNWKDGEETVSWEDSSLRYWLNNDFYDSAFTDGEKKTILYSNLKADINPDFDTTIGNDTEDKVFLLSMEEAKKYLPEREKRVCTATEFSITRGAENASHSVGCWWLRTIGAESAYVAIVKWDGEIDTHGFHSHYSECAVRPAMWVRVEP